MENEWKPAPAARKKVGGWGRDEESGATCEANEERCPGDADECEARSLTQLLDGTWFRCFAGLTLVFLGTWLLNQYLFPSFMGVYPLAREAATVSSCTTYLFTALLAMRRPSTMHPGYLALVGLSLHILGFAVVVAGLAACQPAVLTVGVVAMNAGRSVIALYAGVALVTLTASPAALAIASAAACSHVLRWVIAAAPDLVGFAALAVAPFAIVAFTLRPVSLVLDYARTRPDAGTLALTEPQSFLPFAHVLFVAFFVFRVAWGFSLTFNAVEGVPVTTALALVPIGAVALYVLFARCAASADVLYRMSSLLVLAGFLAILVPQATPILASDVPNTLLAAGGDCFTILFYYTLAAVGRRNVLNALPAFAWGQCATSSGTLAGTALGHLANTLALHDVLLLPGTIALVVLAFVAFNQCALHSFSFDRTIAGIEPVVLVEQRGASEDEIGNGEAGAFEGEAAASVAEEPPAAEGASFIERQCEAVAAEFGLTEREAEVFRLLARGRNVPFIEEELIISRNTIKTHIKHIYQKLDVHSQQELIDMTELR